MFAEIFFAGNIFWRDFFFADCGIAKVAQIKTRKNFMPYGNPKPLTLTLGQYVSVLDVQENV